MSGHVICCMQIEQVRVLNIVPSCLNTQLHNKTMSKVPSNRIASSQDVCECCRSEMRRRLAAGLFIQNFDVVEMYHDALAVVQYRSILVVVAYNRITYYER